MDLGRLVFPGTVAAAVCGLVSLVVMAPLGPASLSFAAAVACLLVLPAERRLRR